MKRRSSRWLAVFALCGACVGCRQAGPPARMASEAVPPTVAPATRPARDEHAPGWPRLVGAHVIIHFGVVGQRNNAFLLDADEANRLARFFPRVTAPPNTNTAIATPPSFIVEFRGPDGAFDAISVYRGVHDDAVAYLDEIIAARRRSEGTRRNRRS